MSYYRDHSHEGRDPDSLAELRARCAAVLSGALGREVPVETMMSAIRFRAFPDAAPALAELRGLGLKLVCVSNWDASLPEVLERCGLGGCARRRRHLGPGRCAQARPGDIRRPPSSLPAARPGRGALRRRHSGRGPGGGARRRHPRPADRSRGRARTSTRWRPSGTISTCERLRTLAGPQPRTRAAAWSGPADDQPRTWGPARVAGGIGALLLTSVFEVSWSPPSTPTSIRWRRRLVTQALLAGTLVGIAFAVAAGRAGGLASPGALGLRRPCDLRSAWRPPPTSATSSFALVYSALVHPQQEDVTRDLGLRPRCLRHDRGRGPDRDRRTVLGGDLLSRLHLRRPANAASRSRSQRSSRG